MRPAGQLVLLYSLGDFFASGLVAFSGLVGGGAGEEGVSGGFPAGSGVGEVADDQRGFLIAAWSAVRMGSCSGPGSWVRR